MFSLAIFLNIIPNTTFMDLKKILINNKYAQAEYLKEKTENFIIEHRDMLKRNMVELKENLDKDQLAKILEIFCDIDIVFRNFDDDYMLIQES